MTAGYSGKPLAQKLGIKAGQRLIILNAPDDYTATLGELPAGVEAETTFAGQFDFIHYFTMQRAELETELPRLKAALLSSGMLWISWPKKSAKMDTDLSDNVVRESGLTAGLVDVKVAAVDERWSGLKFVYRLKDR
ncbi:MAG: DUF3052 domain-containing protein [Anaerolineae bacterium]